MSDNARIIIGLLTTIVGLALFILWQRDCGRRARAMNYSLAQTAGQAVAYFLSVCFVCIGALGLWDDFEPRQTLTNPIFTLVFHVVLFSYGLLIWLATRFRYGGGFWSIIGGFLVGGAFVGTVGIIEAQMGGSHSFSPNLFNIRIVSCWGLGSAFLLIGHRRHCKKQQALLDTAPQPPDTTP